LWFAAVLAVTGGFISLTQFFGTRFRNRASEPRAFPTVPMIWIGTASTTVGAGLIGLYGPRNFALVIVTPLLFTFGWLSTRA